MSEQGTDSWFEERLGLCTASRFKDVLAKGQGKTLENYLNQLVAERLTGKRAESYSNAHTDRGTEQEPYARMAYEAKTGNLVDEVGFIRLEGTDIGGSPDGLIGDDGGVEIKSVIPTVQMATIAKGGYPSTHVAQVQGLLWITGREWWDFVSYSPDMPENLRLYIYQVQRDQSYIDKLKAEVTVFLQDVEKKVEFFKSIKG